jgi:hypothetical protein
MVKGHRGDEMGKICLVVMIIVVFVLGAFAGLWAEEGIWDDDDDDDGGSSGSNVVFDAVYKPDIDPDDFSDPADNPYWPMEPGYKYTYEGIDEDETVRIEIEIMEETKVVMGVTCTIFREEEYVDGELEERTDDWFAADNDGNVWYFGEDTAEYEDGEVVTTAGAWESGKNGAYAGIVMLADPIVGMTYRQEFLAGEAEDMGTVISTDESLDVSYGSYDDLLIIQDSTPLEPGIAEYKYYAPGVGMIREEAVKGETGYAELTAFEEPDS